MFDFLHKDNRIINNSDKAVKERLEFLRYIPVLAREYTNWDKNVAFPLGLKEKVTELPRVIEQQIIGFKYTLAILPTELGKYHYTPEQKADIESYYNRGRKDKQGNKYSMERCALECWYSSYKSMSDKTFPRHMVEERRENIVLRQKTVDVNSVEDLQVPQDLANLGMTQERWEERVNWTINKHYYWDVEGYGYQRALEETVSLNGKPYMLLLDPLIDIRINGLLAVRYNLTLTEQQHIIDNFKSFDCTTAYFVSDGKEIYEYAIKQAPGIYSEADLAQSINYLGIYGTNRRTPESEAADERERKRRNAR